jgi:ElaB/YqjD/DUF883 family membrane-anchored ribosome-binding protein
MTSATSEAPDAATSVTLTDRAIDACRRAACLSHEAQVLTSLAADAVDDGGHAVRRTVRSTRRGVEKLADLKDEAVHRVKRQPLRAVSVAVGVGLVLGLAIGWIGRGQRSRRETHRLLGRQHHD